MTMREFVLPSRTGGGEPGVIRGVRQITLIGANGAGKTRFMNEMTRTPGVKPYCLSALSAAFPERHPSNRPESIDMLYAEAVRTRPYMRSDAVSEIDKLAYMLITDEFDTLLQMKIRTLAGEHSGEPRRTRLDTLIAVWRKVFPASQILRHSGRLMFLNDNGDDPIGTMTLSQGEKTVFYYVAAVLYAPAHAVIFIDSPTLFLHPAILNPLWNTIESLRPDCTFVYNTSDTDFVNTRTDNICVWIRNYDAEHHSWSYDVLDSASISDELMVDIAGSRKPVLFIEGDREHSIDARLYTLVFSDYTVRPLGSCDKVIETTRTFNDLKTMHHLDSHGIVDRDRRTQGEVDYLRRKKIFVPEVAEVENIFLLEGVVRAMAEARGRDELSVMQGVSQEVTTMFARHYERQALEHVRHQLKRAVECKIDARFTCITALETHLRQLPDQLRPRQLYYCLRSEFASLVERGDYAGILRVFNHKPMLGDCGVAHLLGYPSKEAYIAGVLAHLNGTDHTAERLRRAVKECFLITDELDVDPPEPYSPYIPQSVPRQATAIHRREKKNKKRHRRRHLHNDDC